jgi:hypothetical protein
MRPLQFATDCRLASRSNMFFTPTQEEQDATGDLGT